MDDLANRRGGYGVSLLSVLALLAGAIAGAWGSQFAPRFVPVASLVGLIAAMVLLLVRPLVEAFGHRCCPKAVVRDLLR